MTGPSQPPPPSSSPQAPTDGSFVVVVNNLESHHPHGNGEAEASDLKKKPAASPKYGGDDDDDDVELGHNKATTDLSNTNSNSKHVSTSSKDDALADGDTVCRVCHLGLASGTSESIILGCACKQDLALCHRDCAEEWFKIRGNTVCEICGETAKNVRIALVETTASSTGGDAAAVVRVDEGREGNEAQQQQQQQQGNNMSRLRYLWANQLVRNSLLATMIVVFMVPWFFRIAYF